MACHSCESRNPYYYLIIDYNDFFVQDRIDEKLIIMYRF